jgi:hypothetical protein
MKRGLCLLFDQWLCGSGWLSVRVSTNVSVFSESRSVIGNLSLGVWQCIPLRARY